MATCKEKDSINTKPEINILLLGETGIGKSTFINSLINYVQFNSFEDARRNIHGLRCVIPTRFVVTDNQFNEKVVQYGSNDNENTSDAESATLKTKSYLINLPKHKTKLRIIDTPGIGDTRGINQDDKNLENIIHYVANLNHIDVICILLKANQARSTIAFQYCMNQLLLCFHKMSTANIIFTFTNTSNSFFRPGDSICSLQKILKDIQNTQNVEIILNNNNVFCLDNESFRYLLAKRSGVLFGNEKIFSSSWSQSHRECWRIIKFAIGVPSYNIDSTLYIYKTRQKLEEFIHSFTDILDDSDEGVLQELPGPVGKGDSVEIEYTHQNIEKIECKKSDLMLQISKFIAYLHSNSLILCNEYCEEYIKYMIDTENSMGAEGDRRSIRDYYNLMKYYKNVKEIINMNIHIDPFSLITTREELSNIFPDLEANVSALRNGNYTNEVNVHINRCDVEPIEEDDKIEPEESSTPFSFNEWFDLIKDTALHVGDTYEKVLDYEELRKQFAKGAYPTSSSEFNRSNPHLSNKQTFKYDSSIGETSSIIERRRSKNKRGKSPNAGNLPMFRDHDLMSEKDENDFVLLDNPQPNKIMDGFRGRGRGYRGGNRPQQSYRGRGFKQNQSDCRNQQNTRPFKPQQRTRNKPDTNNQRGGKVRKNIRTEVNASASTDAEIPKNLLQSMKTLFD